VFHILFAYSTTSIVCVDALDAKHRRDDIVAKQTAGVVLSSVAKPAAAVLTVPKRRSESKVLVAGVDEAKSSRVVTGTVKTPPKTLVAAKEQPAKRQRLIMDQPATKTVAAKTTLSKSSDDDDNDIQQSSQANDRKRKQRNTFIDSSPEKTPTKACGL
jgi:hypothetical protein